MNKFTIKDMSPEDRPQEKLIKLGPSFLSNAELLALIIRTGTKDMTSVELGQKILNYSFKTIEDTGLRNLYNISLKDLTLINGIGISKASMIMAAIELGKRMGRISVYNKFRINSPKDAVEYVMSEMRVLSVEELRIIILNTKKEVLNVKTITRGIIDGTMIHPREIFKVAIDEGAHCIILVHNHPSGDVTPSKEDIEVTKRLKASGELLGIPVADHIIIGDLKYYSFLEEGKF